MESKIISQLNRDYTRDVGKHYLMYGNLRSTLIRFSQRTIYLNIQVSSKWTKSPDETALQIAESWRRHQSALELANSYVVSLIHTTSPERKTIIQGRL